MAVKRIGPATQHKKRGGWSRRHPKTPEVAAPIAAPPKQIVEDLAGVPDSLQGSVPSAPIPVDISDSSSTYIEYSVARTPAIDILGVADSPQTYVESVVQSPLNIDPGGIQNASSTYIEVDGIPVSISNDIVQSESTYIEQIPYVSNDIGGEGISDSPSTYIESVGNRGNISSDIQDSPSTYTEYPVLPVDISPDIPDSPATYVETEIIPVDIKSSNIQDSQSTYIEQTPYVSPVAIAELPDAQTTFREKVIAPVDLMPEIQDSPPTFRERISPPALPMAELIGNIYTIEDPSADKLARREFKFGNGRWIPDAPGISLGNDNYQTLKNFRYSNTGLDGVDGFTRINTNATGKYLKTGIQLRTPYSQESYILAQGEDSDGTDRILIKNTADIPSTGDFSGIQVKYAAGNLYFYTRLAGDPATETPIMPIVITPSGTGYTATGLAEELERRLNLNAILRQGLEDDPFTVAFSSNMFTITCTGGVSISYVHSGSSAASYFGFTADIALGTSISGPEVTDFYTPFYPEDSSASRGRMAILPRGNVGFCDQNVNLIWAGDEMPVDACFTYDTTTGIYNDVTDRANNKSTDDSSLIKFTPSINWCAVSDAITIVKSGNIVTYTNTTDSTAFTYLDPGMAVVIACTNFDAANRGTFTVVSHTDNSFSVVNPSGNTESGTSAITSVNDIKTYQTILIVGSTRKLSSVKFYFETANRNAQTGTMTVASMVNGTWTTSTGTDSTESFSTTLYLPNQSITISDVSPTPYIINGRELYFYKFTPLACDASVTYITCSAEIQPIGDMWDGGLRTATLCYVYRTADPVHNTYTEEIADTSTYDTPIGAELGGLVAGTEYMIVGFSERCAGFRIQLVPGHVNDPSTPATMTVSYWNGTNWQAVDDIVDGTFAVTSLIQDGYVTWDNVPEEYEKKREFRGIEGYMYKFTWSAQLDDSGSDRKNVIIDVLSGISAFQSISKSYIFPHMHGNRSMLCGCISDNEQHRVDYSMRNAPDVYNGDDSSKRDHSQSLYFGSTEPLTGAVELFNQFGQEISTVSLFFKNSETYLLNGDTPDDFQIFKVSDSIGCPSPYSIDSAEVAFDAGDSIKQNVAVWCSSKGPVLFYGNTIIPIWEDIKCYFDPSNDLCVPATYLYRIAGCVDPQHNCYHLLIPSGSYATTCNVWIVYDFIRRKWYEIDPGVDDPQFIFRVEDKNGAKYLYALTDTGYMLRLNNGRYWSTSSYGITSTVKTSDLLLTDSMWDRTTIRRMKVLLETDTAGYLEVNHYLNGYATATTDSSSATIKLDSAKAISKTGYGYRNLVFSPAYTSSSRQHLISGLTHSFQFDSTLYTKTHTKPRLFGYGIQYQVEREDTIDMG